MLSSVSPLRNFKRIISKCREIAYRKIHMFACRKSPSLALKFGWTYQRKTELISQVYRDLVWFSIRHSNNESIYNAVYRRAYVHSNFFYCISSLKVTGSLRPTPLHFVLIKLKRLCWLKASGFSSFYFRSHTSYAFFPHRLWNLFFFTKLVKNLNWEYGLQVSRLF